QHLPFTQMCLLSVHCHDVGGLAFGQQGWFDAPQAVQVLLEQASPALHVPPEQQGWLCPPHSPPSTPPSFAPPSCAPPSTLLAQYPRGGSPTRLSGQAVPSQQMSPAKQSPLPLFGTQHLPPTHWPLPTAPPQH